MELIANFLDGEGRLKTWPSKRVKKLAALVYLGGKFVPGRRYTEREVNELLLSWHLFQDPAQGAGGARAALPRAGRQRLLGGGKPADAGGPAKTLRLKANRGTDGKSALRFFYVHFRC